MKGARLKEIVNVTRITSIATTPLYFISLLPSFSSFSIKPFVIDLFLFVKNIAYNPIHDHPEYSFLSFSSPFLDSF